MMPARRPDSVAAAVGILLSGIVTMVMLWPALRGGYLLYRDFITVPDPALGARAWGFSGPAPRAVPLDAVMAMLDPVVPTWLQQKVMLFGSLWCAGAGVAVLLRRRGVLAAALGGVVGTWSTFAAERLLLGQAPTLLAWSALPWLVMVSRLDGPALRRALLTLLVALPAALTPSGGLTVAAAALVLSRLERRTGRESMILLVLGLGWCLPWLVPALGGRTGAGVSEGAAAFRIEATGVRGVLDVFTGGGVWAEGASLASRDRPLAAAAMVALLLLAGLGLTRVAASRRRLLGLGLIGPPVVALVLATPIVLPALAAAQSLPGIAVFRDTHRLLALSGFALALLVPLGATALLDRLGRRVRGRLATLLTALGVATATAAVAVLAAPDAPPRLHTAYRPAQFPADWDRVVAAVGGSRALLAPWQPMRQVSWNGELPFLDPLPLALHGEVVAASDLLVQRHGERYRVGRGDPPLATEWQAGRVDPPSLRRVGISTVVEWRGTPGAPTRTVGLRLVLRTPNFLVWHIE